MKKKILLALSFLAVIGLSIGGTVAYFTAQDTDVNTFTYGKVAIEQLQYERAVDANGNWISTGVKDKYGFIPDKVVPYENNKQLVPAVFTTEDGNIHWDLRVDGIEKHELGAHNQSWSEIGAPGSQQLFDKTAKNVHDNFVFVKNTGSTDAYVRTCFAFEQGDILKENYQNVIMKNTNKAHWSWSEFEYNVTIYDDNNQGNDYVVTCATYLGAGSKGKNGILASGETSYASLLQFYMHPKATQEDVELLDGNNNGQFDILVATQAVQVDGFKGLYNTGLEDANNAFEKAFENKLPFKTEIE